MHERLVAMIAEISNWTDDDIIQLQTTHGIAYATVAIDLRTMAVTADIFFALLPLSHTILIPV